LILIKLNFAYAVINFFKKAVKLTERKFPCSRGIQTSSKQGTALLLLKYIYYQQYIPFHVIDRILSWSLENYLQLHSATSHRTCNSQFVFKRDPPASRRLSPLQARLGFTSESYSSQSRFVSSPVALTGNHMPSQKLFCLWKKGFSEISS